MTFALFRDGTHRLEDFDRTQLLMTARSLLAEANALSSRIAAVNEIGIAINQSLDLAQILQVIASKAKWLLDFEHCSVCLRRPDGAWQVETLFGAPIEIAEQPLDESSNIGSTLRTGQATLLRSGSDSPYLRDFASQIIIPLVIEGKVLGTINFALRRAEVYRQDDLRIAYMLGLQLAGAIRNANYILELETAHNELREYAAELESRNQELHAYSRTIAHDLKSPLSGILLKTELVQQNFAYGNQERALEHIDSIGVYVAHMSEMIDQLLMLAQLRDREVSVEAVEAQAVVEAAVMRFSAEIERKAISLKIAPNLPPALGYAQWVCEVFANLVGNAIKYMGENNPSPRIEIRGERQGTHVRYEVSDTGIGIAPEDQGRLFQLFGRLETINADGLGLGLSIVYRIVTRLHGEVGIDSVPGRGSTFWFTLPAADTLSETGR